MAKKGARGAQRKPNTIWPLLALIPEWWKVGGKKLKAERKNKIFQASKQHLSDKKMPKELKILNTNLRAEIVFL